MIQIMKREETALNPPESLGNHAWIWVAALAVHGLLLWALNVGLSKGPAEVEAERHGRHDSLELWVPWPAVTPSPVSGPAKPQSMPVAKPVRPNPVRPNPVRSNPPKPDTQAHHGAAIAPSRCFGSHSSDRGQQHHHPGQLTRCGIDDHRLNGAPSRRCGPIRHTRPHICHCAEPASPGVTWPQARLSGLESTAGRGGHRVVAHRRHGQWPGGPH